MRLMNHGPRRVDPLLFVKAGPSIVSLQVGMLLGATGPNVTVNSLCASGGEVIATASDQIRAGYADVMVAASADASLSELGIAALGIVGALSRETNPDRASRPFDLNRNGFVYGEGCGVMILESLKHAQRRDAPILGEVAGAWRNFDAYDSTAPRAETQAAAMRLALRQAGVRPEELSYVNAHGTSTKLNDATETKALKMALGEHAYRIPVSSFKSMFGHMVTAAGIVESIGTVLAMEHGLIPPTIHYETPDPDCDLDYVPNTARQAEINVALKNSFGLGGQNCCVVLSKFKD
jgi:3-oxoacyl-[acyl-carrier-protein] synthase II